MSKKKRQAIKNAEAEAYQKRLEENADVRRLKAKKKGKHGKKHQKELLYYKVE